MIGRGLRTTVIFHEAEALGAGIAVARIAEPLKEHGWSLNAWLPDKGDLHRELSHFSGVDVAAQGKPLAYSTQGWRAGPGVRARLARSPNYLAQVAHALRCRRPHVVHANTLLSLPEATIARRLGIPVVLHVHELPPPSLKRRGVLRWAAAVADVIVVVCAPVADMMSDSARGIPVIVVHNGVPQPIATPCDHDRRDSIVVGTVGAVSSRKGTDTFIEAARQASGRMRSLRFEHVGPSGLADPEFEHAALEAASDVPALAMRGRVDGVSAIASWDIFTLPSRQDPFPLVVLEAMAAGKAIVASSVGGIPELLGAEAGVLLPPDDPAALANTILSLAEDRKRRLALGAAARARAEDSFALSDQAAATSDAYLTAIARRFAPRDLAAAIS